MATESPAAPPSLLTSRILDIIQPRTASESCIEIKSDQIIFSKTAFIASLTLLISLTVLSLIAASILLYREISRRKQQREAKNWGRRSRFVHRISTMRKEVDDEFSRKYNGCLVNEYPENPEMGSESPVEIGFPEQKIWEAPAVPAVPARVEVSGRGGRKSKVGSLFFDSKVGLWMPRR